MRVGYTIIRLAALSQEKEFARFLKECLILEEGYSDNIARVLIEGSSVNIYTRTPLESYLDGQGEYAFQVTYTPICVESPQYLVASAVDFKVEFQYLGGVKALVPTEYFITTESLARTLQKEISQGLLRVFPSLPKEFGTGWILEEGEWNDGEAWVDDNHWKDYADE